MAPLLQTGCTTGGYIETKAVSGSGLKDIVILETKNAVRRQFSHMLCPEKKIRKNKSSMPQVPTKAQFEKLQESEQRMLIEIIERRLWRSPQVTDS